jgi:hypothetical protein
MAYNNTHEFSHPKWLGYVTMFMETL